jgi:hypothetical protein
VVMVMSFSLSGLVCTHRGAIASSRWSQRNRLHLSSRHSNIIDSNAHEVRIIEVNGLW